MQTYFVTSFTKTPHIYENMTPRDFTKNTVWGREINKKDPCEFFALPLKKNILTSTLQCHYKEPNTSQASLFYLLPTEILTDIEIWVSGLKHCDKFKLIT